MKSSSRSQSGIGHSLNDSASDDSRLVELAQEFLKRLQSGESPAIEHYASRIPELASEIRDCLAGLQLVHRSVRNNESAATQAAVSSPSPSLTGEPLGDFRLVRELGRGGMGIVYEAVQTSLARRVALKVLPFTATLQPRQLQRFLNEAHAAAHLHHPNIVPVFAVGSDRGVHYYAMQLIEGMSLAELLVRLRRTGPFATPSDASGGSVVIEPGSVEIENQSPDSTTIEGFSFRLSTEQSMRRSDYFRTVAQFGLQAAEALGYAHDLGIIHRDIKPANLMVDARGRVWVTDFGLAQVQASENLTMTGDVVGTLRYMSPEQLRGSRDLLDQRTDIYSLGATLYELATLKPVVTDGSRESLHNQVLNQEPVSPRKINRFIPQELETIITKSISKAPSDRYSTSQQLAEDLKRFLSDKPILARRPTLIDHGRKWARRHPLTVISAGLILMAMSIGLMIHNRLIATEQRRTTDALQREQARAAEAEQSFRQARKAVDLLIQIGEEEMAEKPQMQATRKRLLTAALEYYQDFIAHHQSDAAAAKELAAVEQRVQGILRELSIVDGLFQVLPVMMTEVQDDLGLSADQRKQIGDFQRKLDDERREFFSRSSSSSEQRHQRLVQFAEVQAAKLGVILSDAQQDRLKQISLQMRGMFVFQEAEIISALRLTPDQQKKVRQIEFEIFSSRMGRPNDRPPGQEPENHEFRSSGRRDEEDRRMREAVQKMVELLDSNQKKVWRELTGPAFKGQLIGFPGGFLGGPHQHDRRFERRDRRPD